eukprot:3941002-Rhodomonas_salina.5
MEADGHVIGTNAHVLPPPSYGCATRCPVLKTRVGVRYCTGSDSPYSPAAACLGAARELARSLEDYQMEVQARSAITGTDLAYGATRTSSLRTRSRQVPYQPSLSAYARAMRCPASGSTLLTPGPIPAINLRVCYAMSGTDIAHGASSYAHAMRSPVVNSAIGLRACYAMSGTDLVVSLLLVSGTDVCGVPLRPEHHHLRPIRSPSGR